MEILQKKKKMTENTNEKNVCNKKSLTRIPVYSKTFYKKVSGPNYSIPSTHHHIDSGPNQRCTTL